MHICRIRRKLREAEASSLEVETVYGRGYALRLRSDEGRLDDQVAVRRA
jgi:DNA-binding response OmpR family regulator